MMWITRSLSDHGVQSEYTDELLKVRSEFGDEIALELSTTMLHLYLCGFDANPSEYDRNHYIDCSVLAPLFFSYIRNRQFGLSAWMTEYSKYLGEMIR